MGVCGGWCVGMQAREIVERELGRPLGEVFASFEETPFSAASVGQVRVLNRVRVRVRVRVRAKVRVRVRIRVTVTVKDTLRGLTLNPNPNPNPNPSPNPNPNPGRRRVPSPHSRNLAVGFHRKSCPRNEPTRLRKSEFCGGRCTGPRCMTVDRWLSRWGLERTLTRTLTLTETLTLTHAR